AFVASSFVSFCLCKTTNRRRFSQRTSLVLKKVQYLSSRYSCLISDPAYKSLGPMDNDLSEEPLVPSALLESIKFGVATESDKVKTSVLEIDALSQVTDSKLGLPNPTSQCSTCGAKNLKSCEGHFGVINFPFTIINPYYLSEVAQILNKICPGCKSIRKDLHVKAADLMSREHQYRGCNYCLGRSADWYPSMKFKVSSNDVFKKTAIVVEIIEKRKNKKGILLPPSDFWDFIPKDPQHEENVTKPNRRILSHAQVHHLLDGIDPKFIKKYVSRIDLLFINCFPVTPNNHRVTEITHAFSNGQRLIFDTRTRAYKKLVDFRGSANELSSRVLDCLKISKVYSDKSTSEDPYEALRKNKDTSFTMSGLRYMKDVVLGKRNDHCFRMVVIGDPNLKLSEIGIPCHIAESLQISEFLNRFNLEILKTCCGLRLLEKGEIYVRRKGCLVRVRRVKDLQLGDIIYRPLSDGDTVLINRPPSIHQHSLIALSVKILPTTSVLSINPLCCPPFHGDFDGDCLHGYVSQSVESRTELNELVALNKQLINGQSGRNLLSLTQDSLTALHLVMEDGVLFNLSEMQQLEMFCPHRLSPPAIVKAPSIGNYIWTGKQLFSMLLPPGLEYDFPKNNVYISDGELITSSEGSAWLHDADGNLFQSIIKHCQGKTLDFLYSAQEVLCEWLSMRGFSVSLSDLYLSSDSQSRGNMMDEIYCGLQEAEQTCDYNQLMVESCQDLLAGSGEEDQDAIDFDVERLCYEKQRSAALSQASVDAFKQVFRDVQHLVYRYISKDNSLLAMYKAGSKGNLLKLVQHSMCLGLQHSLVPLSFSFPHQLSCAAWNNHKLPSDHTTECPKSFIPSAVVENSFLTGLNPLETFVHSVTSRDSSFSDNADLPGTLSRRLMFFMRDLYTAYDGTVRNAYGNQIVQFSYNTDKDTSRTVGTHNSLGESTNDCDGIGSHPVGALSACAISEAAYSALDQPISLLETSPLLNLKKVLECGSKKSTGNQTVSLFLSEKLRRQRHGFEYGALEVKNHLERLLFAEAVSTVLIMYSPQTSSQKHLNPWVCHFHICKEIAKRRGLKVHSIIDSLYMRCKRDLNFSLLDLYIRSTDCSADDKTEEDDTFCITVTIIENLKNPLQLDFIRDKIIPFLLGTVIKGFWEIKKVDIIWNDRPKVSKSQVGSFGELYLRVSTSGDYGGTKFWSRLMNDCLRIIDMIDWTRSHPDNIRSFCLAYGIDAGWKFFLSNLESAISDVGKTILPEHLLLVANCLSATGDFVSLNSKGLAQQREHASVPSPFMQACFTNPSACFTKAAKAGVVDDLRGSIDALGWGKTPSVGTGGHFEIIFSGEEDHKLTKPVDVYELLGSQISSEQNLEIESPNTWNHVPEKYGAPWSRKYNGPASRGLTKWETVIKSFITEKDIRNLSHALKNILHKYPIDHQLNEWDKTILMRALHFHPRSEEKIGSGAHEIKVAFHPAHQNTRCFHLVRTDGTIEDFSYHKCVLGALRIIAPQKAKMYKSKWLKGDTM
ncbi:RNA_pol_Rpb1_2 domain-containing protein/RNA_pol_Rpb1_3 domain-containing protein/RNA_pol_Rpb1_1 domain-containing protein/RNA_pol_Rpb1_4 domain-containing protein/DUF3223 domain-containing protein, partial [Cephalotus follicularis]